MRLLRTLADKLRDGHNPEGISYMTTDTIQQQYNELIAPHYDLDPQSVTGNTLDRAVQQIRTQGLLEDRTDRLRVYDVGMGTGMFLARLMALDDQIQPFGLDLSQKMIECAYQKIPDLAGAVDNAVNLDAHFPGVSFDLICTHFITGFVPLNVLAPKVWSRLEEGGYWSYLGATKARIRSFRPLRITGCCGCCSAAKSSTSKAWS